MANTASVSCRSYTFILAIYFLHSRSQQYECFQKLIYVYESEPENVKKLMELMQDVQE